MSFTPPKNHERLELLSHFIDVNTEDQRGESLAQVPQRKSVEL